MGHVEVQVAVSEAESVHKKTIKAELMQIRKKYRALRAKRTVMQKEHEERCRCIQRELEKTRIEKHATLHRLGGMRKALLAQKTARQDLEEQHRKLSIKHEATEKELYSVRVENHALEAKVTWMTKAVLKDLCTKNTEIVTLKTKLKSAEHWKPGVCCKYL